MKRALFLFALGVGLTLGFAKTTSGGAVAGLEFARLGLNNPNNFDSSGQVWGYYFEFSDTGDEELVESTPLWWVIWEEEVVPVTQTNGTIVFMEEWVLADAGGELEGAIPIINSSGITTGILGTGILPP